MPRINTKSKLLKKKNKKKHIHKQLKVVQEKTHIDDEMIEELNNLDLTMQQQEKNKYADYEFKQMENSMVGELKQLHDAAFGDYCLPSSYYEAIVNNQNPALLLFDRNNSIMVGFSVLFLNKCYIASFGIHSEYRRRGLGNYLLKSTINFIKNKGCQCLTLHVYTGNKAAINLYKKHGFKIIKKLKNHYPVIAHGTTDAYFMKMQLESDEKDTKDISRLIEYIEAHELKNNAWCIDDKCGYPGTVTQLKMTKTGKHVHVKVTYKLVKPYNGKISNYCYPAHHKVMQPKMKKDEYKCIRFIDGKQKMVECEDDNNVKYNIKITSQPKIYEKIINTFNKKKDDQELYVTVLSGPKYFKKKIEITRCIVDAKLINLKQ